MLLKLRSFLKGFLEGTSDNLLSRRNFHSPFEWTPEYADFSNPPTILHLKNVTGYMVAIWISAHSTQMFCLLYFCISCICQQCALFQEIHSLVCRLRDFRSFCNTLSVSWSSWHTGCFELFLTIFSTKMKSKPQPTRATFSRNFQCKRAPGWLSKFFARKMGGPVKTTV